MSLSFLLSQNSRAETLWMAALNDMNNAAALHGGKSPEVAEAERLEEEAHSVWLMTVEDIFKYRTADLSEERRRLLFILSDDTIRDCLPDFKSLLIDAISEGGGDGDPRA